MSEYQYYEFQAIDRPLSQVQMAELRGLSSRADITPTSFVNVYNFGDFRGDPARLMEKHFDAFVYVANWGTRKLMLRLPRELVDLNALQAYLAADVVSLRKTRKHVILEFHSEEESPEWEEGEEWLPALVPLREEILAGDLRGLYLGWLACVPWEFDGEYDQPDLDDKQLEPPVPPGLEDLTTSQQALAEFLRIDESLIAVAAQRSTGRQQKEPSGKQLKAWIKAFPEPEKDEILLRVMQDDVPHLRWELLKRFRKAHSTLDGQSQRRRTAAELRRATKAYVEETRRREAEQRAKQRARREKKEAAEKTKYLDDLAKREPKVWQKVDLLIDTTGQLEYDRAVKLLRELHDLLARSGREDEFASRVSELRRQHGRKRTLMRRFHGAGW